MIQSARVKVPGTTANMGPGFDCLGLALQVYNTVALTRSATPRPDDMVDATAAAFFAAAKKKPFSFSWEITGHVPRSRGMGSSVTVRLGILSALNALTGEKLTRHRLFELCSALEGHPDNAAPAAFGGFTVARSGAPLQRYPVSRSLSVVLLIPDFEVKTADARKVLPKTVSLHDAVISASNSAAIAAAFASRDYKKLRGSFDDRLHQPYRARLIPCLDDVIAAGTKAGALGGWLSGSGSTIACITLQNPGRVAKAMLRASGLAAAQTLVTRADGKGARLLSAK